MYVCACMYAKKIWHIKHILIMHVKCQILFPPERSLVPRLLCTFHTGEPGTFSHVT